MLWIMKFVMVTILNKSKANLFDISFWYYENCAGKDNKQM